MQNSFTELPFRDNMLRTRADYTPITVVSPLDGELITVYNLAPAKVTQVSGAGHDGDPTRKQLFTGVRDHVQRAAARRRDALRRHVDRAEPDGECDEPDNPNIDRFCDQRDTDVPYRTQLKLAGTYPLPWCGIGRRHAAELSRRGHRHVTTSSASGTTWLLTPTTRYAANCVGPCTPERAGDPDADRSVAHRAAAPYRTEFLDRLTQLDLRGSKVFTVGRTRVEAQLELFNVLNSDAADYGARHELRNRGVPAGSERHSGTDNPRRRADEVVEMPEPLED